MPARETPGLPPEPAGWERLDELLFSPPITPVARKRASRALPAPALPGAAATETLPATPKPAADVGSALRQISVNLDPEIHLRLREAAAARGSIRLMSEIVRECIEAELAVIDALDDEARIAYAAELRAENTGRRGWRTVAYQLDADQRLRILPLSGRLLLPMGFVVAAALARRFGDETADASG